MKHNKTKLAHTSKSQSGRGDFYGSGIRNKIGTSREDSMAPKISKKQIRTPPKKLA